MTPAAGRADERPHMDRLRLPYRSIRHRRLSSIGNLVRLRGWPEDPRRWYVVANECDATLLALLAHGKSSPPRPQLRDGLLARS
jgi:hypothetical protein